VGKLRKGEIRESEVGKRLVDLAIIGMLLLAAYFAIFGGEYTVFQMRGLEALEEQRGAELTAVEAEIDSLQAVAYELENDPEAIERVARERYGMIRDGEILYRFREAMPPDSTAADAAQNGQ
jgi:cell division protein FtsB